MFDRFSREDRTLFMFATQEAHDLGHSSIGNDHLILGMLCNARSPMFDVLRDLGFTLDGARATVAGYHDGHDDASGASDAAGRYEEDREALRSIGIDLDRVRDAVRSRFGDDLADGWGERSGRGRGRGECGERRGPHGRGRGPGFGPGPDFGRPGWAADGPWEGGRGRRGPRGRGRGRMSGPVRDGVRSAVELARTRGDDRIDVAHLLLGILDVNDDASRTLIESVSDTATVRAAAERLLEPAAV